MSEITRKPTRVGTALSLLAAVLALLGATLGAPSAALAGLAGFLVLAVGLFVPSNRLVTVGGALLFGGVLLAGYLGSAPEPLLVGGVGSVLAWDVGSNALSVGRQLGRETETARLEVTHAAVSLLVGTLTIGIGYGVYVAAGGGRPVAAVVFLMAGALALTSAFR